MTYKLKGIQLKGKHYCILLKGMDNLSQKRQCCSNIKKLVKVHFGDVCFIQKHNFKLDC